MSIYNISNWSSASIYAVNDIVRYPSDTNFFYYSQTNSNENNVPSASSTAWGGIGSFNGITKSKFIWKPNYGVTVIHEPDIFVVRFGGGGYEQRLETSINNGLIKIDLTFELRTDKETEAITHFLYSKRAKESFLYTPNKPHDLEQLYICRSWSEKFIYYNNHSLQCVFEQIPI